MSDTYEMTIPVSVRLCPLCGASMYASGDIEIPGDPGFHEIVYAVQMEIAKNEERAITEHYQQRHRLRYWLWMKFGWKRVLW